MTDTTVTTRPPAELTTDLARFMPQNITELTRFADTIAKSGLFGTTTPQQTLVMMMYGAELGLNPLAAMREIYLIPGKGDRLQMLPSAALIAARIQQSPDCQKWETETDARHCTIRFQRKGRNAQSITVTIDDIPKRYFAPSRNGQPSNWTLVPEDMLFAWTVRRVARRHFADKLIAIQPEVDEIDESKVIDVRRVEREIRQEGPYEKPHHPKGPQEHLPQPDCPGRVWLQASNNGGAFLICDACGATWSPPQEVRDAIRGIPAHLTLAAATEAQETALEPGEREVTPDDLEGIEPPADANDSAVQSESERDTIGEDRTPPEPASAENAPQEPEPVGETVAPAVAAERAAEAEAKSIDWMERWRIAARAAIIAHIDKLRALPGSKPPERQDAIKALKALGWDGEIHSDTFVEQTTDETLAALLQEFRLEALPKSTPEETL